MLTGFDLVHLSGFPGIFYSPCPEKRPGTCGCCVMAVCPCGSLPLLVAAVAVVYGELIVFEEPESPSEIDVRARLDKLEGFRHAPGDSRNDYDRIRVRVTLLSEESRFAQHATQHAASQERLTKPRQSLCGQPLRPSAAEEGEEGAGAGVQVDAWTYLCRLDRSSYNGVLVEHGNWRRYVQEHNVVDSLEPLGSSQL